MAIGHDGIMGWAPRGLPTQGDHDVSASRTDRRGWVGYFSTTKLNVREPVAEDSVTKSPVALMRRIGPRPGKSKVRTSERAADCSRSALQGSTVGPSYRSRMM